MKREPTRFSELLIKTDLIQCDNHRTCLESFLSTNYSKLHKQNQEAAEQYNSVLRAVSRSVALMKFENYISSIKVFIAFYNLRE